MSVNNATSRFAALLSSLLIAGPGGAQQGPAPMGSKPIAVKLQASERTSAATRAMMLSAAEAGNRIVAVGDHGIVLLSDDHGVTFRQARSVPAHSMLTAVSFVDDKNGWAVGHWGVVLKTSDGGETWEVQRVDTAVDQPLFSVFFKNKHEGWAVGLWSLMLATRDGGKTWAVQKLPVPPNGGKADRNLFKIFANAKGDLFVAAEQGFVLRSQDDGANWTYVNTGYKGSFWTGVALDDGTLLVGGLRGNIYRSIDDGQTWQQAESSTRSSITDFVTKPGKIMATGLDGTLLESSDGGKTFKSSQREDRMTLTAGVDPENKKLVVFSKTGPVSERMP